MLSALKALGVRLAVDDFGTGFSSLSYLARFPVDQLKIDRSFVRIREDRQTIITESIVRLARGLGLETIGEGIEEAWQHEQLRSMGCALGQGYLFGRPMPAEEITERLGAERRLWLGPGSSRSDTAA